MERSQTHDYLRAKIQIGNVKGPVSYNLNQTVFHHDDIPETKRLRRNEVKAWAKSKVLSVETPSWNKSTKSMEPVVLRRQMENYANDRGNAYQYNYRAETLDPLRLIEPIDKPTKFHISTQLETRALEVNEIKSSDRIQRGNFTRTGEMPNHPNLVDATPWNVSTETDVREKEKRLEAMTLRAKEWTGRVNSSPERFTKPYVGPLQGTIELQNTIRKQKMEGTFSIKKQVNCPGATPVDRTKFSNRLLNEHPSVYTKHSHSGVFEVNRVTGRYGDSFTVHYTEMSMCTRYMLLFDCCVADLSVDNLCALNCQCKSLTCVDCILSFVQVDVVRHRQRALRVAWRHPAPRELGLVQSGRPHASADEAPPLEAYSVQGAQSGGAHVLINERRAKSMFIVRKR